MCICMCVYVCVYVCVYIFSSSLRCQYANGYEAVYFLCPEGRRYAARSLSARCTRYLSGRNGPRPSAETELAFRHDTTQQNSGCGQVIVLTHSVSLQFCHSGSKNNLLCANSFARGSGHLQHLALDVRVLIKRISMFVPCISDD